VAVRLGDAVVGALACYWAVPQPGVPVVGRALLEAAATAIAPTVRLAVELASRPSPRTDGSSLIGASDAMARVRLAVDAAARVPFTVLIEGESGSGKELVAREIHRLGPRRQRAFCAINCAALTDELCEAELFGHARGAFTGAVGDRAGLFEEADGGTLFLDEVSELSPRAQAKLLRAIQEGEIRRVGETRPRRVDVRLMAATNRPLADAVGRGEFRADLRYRLDVIHLTLPPLRERPEDLPQLASHFWELAIERAGSQARLGADAVAALARYDWPGNVRELQNVLAALSANAPRRGVVPAAALPVMVREGGAGGGLTLEEARRRADERVVRAALAEAGGHRGRAATALGVTRQGLAKLVDRLQIDPRVDRPST
jgi:two-component system response regulator HydG